MSAQDDLFMSRALELAKKGLYQVAPNPMVGAVIVHKGMIIGEGYHRRYGEAHAEVNAIHSVENKALLAESTIYVTLEPCSHHGKTPPCSDLIIDMKIKEVVVANIDPSEKVGGKGIERLRQNGILVRTGIMEREAAKLNKRFLSLHGIGRPYITLKWALSKDGFIGRDPNDPEHKDSWITNALSKQLVHQWRAEEMGILVGKNTAQIDDPELNCREFNGNDPTRFLIDPELELKSNAKIFMPGAKTIVLNRRKTAIEGNVQFVQFNKSKELFDKLFSYCKDHSIHSILVEGGAYTLREFIQNNLWDEARIFHGNKEFKRGLKGPDFPFEPFEEEQLREDHIQYFKNNTP